MSVSDDEAPEEIGLSTGKSQAARIRSQEQAQRKQQSLSNKKRRRNSDNNSLASGLIQQTGKPAEEESQQDCVPDEVIEALTAADKYGRCTHPCRTHSLSTGIAWLHLGLTDVARLVQLRVGLVPALRPMTLQTSCCNQWHNPSVGNGSSCPSAQQAQSPYKC